MGLEEESMSCLRRDGSCHRQDQSTQEKVSSKPDTIDAGDEWNQIFGWAFSIKNVINSM